jgi:hypothetical protein
MTPEGFDWGFWLATVSLPLGLSLMIVSNRLAKRRREEFTAGLVPALPLLFIGTLIIMLAVGYHVARLRGV